MAELCIEGAKRNVENVYTMHFNFSSIFTRDP